MQSRRQSLIATRELIGKKVLVNRKHEKTSAAVFFLLYPWCFASHLLIKNHFRFRGPKMADVVGSSLRKCGSNALDDLSLEEAFARAATRPAESGKVST